MENVSSKRELFDFLWDWAENKGNWAKLLLKEILENSTGLTDETRLVIYKYFRKGIGLKEELEDISIKKPTCSFSRVYIQLNKLGKITGINRLSSESVIEFSPNLTVIYGENGTGKSGFSRILKNIGFSYEAETKLLPNIYSDEKGEMSAEIDYLCGKESKQYHWAPNRHNCDLKNVSVFNSSCVSISLSENRNLIVTPLGFHLFDLVSRELDSLTQLLNKEKAELITNYDWFENFHEGTEYYDLIFSLNTSSKEKIEKFSKFTETDEKALLELEKEEKNLSIELINKEIKDLNSQFNELTEIEKLLEMSQLNFPQTQWEKLRTVSNNINDLEKKGQGNLSDLAKEKGMELFGQPQFEAFIKAANVYLGTRPDDKYPDIANAKCIYCNQSLSDLAAVDLIKKYREILHDTTQKDLIEKRAVVEKLKISFQKVTKEIILHQPSFGLDRDEKPIQPEIILDYNKAINLLSDNINTNNYANEDFSINYKSIIDSVGKKIEEIQSQRTQKENTKNNLDNKKTSLASKINKLKDKKLFTEKSSHILNIIADYETIHKLNENVSAFNTSSISTKTTQARKELVEQEFEQIFKNELASLRKSHLKIELNFGTTKGATNIRQKLQGSYALSDILSEGEQKAISLAEFLTELNIDGNNSPVVFDDPVNSLDHHIIDEVAKRLLKLAVNRQTIVFTHSILLFNSLLYKAKQRPFKAIKTTFFNSENQYEICGVITEASEEINSAANYIKMINLLLNNTPKDRPEKEVIAEGYGYLRSAIELTVEHEILKGTVKRYQKNISLTKFAELSGIEIDKYKGNLNDVFEKCCGYIVGHSNPTEVTSTPDLKQLKTDFESYSKIRKVFLPNE